MKYMLAILVIIAGFSAACASETAGGSAADGKAIGESDSPTVSGSASDVLWDMETQSCQDAADVAGFIACVQEANRGLAGFDKISLKAPSKSTLEGTRKADTLPAHYLGLERSGASVQSEVGSNLRFNFVAVASVDYGSVHIAQKGEVVDACLASCSKERRNRCL